MQTRAEVEYGRIHVVSKSATNVHLVYGEDDYLVETAARRILEAAVPMDLRQTAIETIDGAADNMDAQLASLKACQASIQTPPFLDPVKLTWWRNVTFLPGGGRNGRLSEAVKTQLEAFAKNLAERPLPANQVLIVTATKLLKTSVFAKTFAAFAEVLEFAGGGRNQDRQRTAAARLPDLAVEAGVAFAPGVDVAFLATVGTDTRVIVNELAKLKTYLGDEDRPVSKADVAEVCCVGGEEPEPWDLTDALGTRNAQKLVSTCQKFAGDDGQSIRLANAAEKFFRELIVVRDALDQKWLTAYGAWSPQTPPDAVADLNAAGIGPAAGKNAWLLKKQIASARNFTLRELRVARFRTLKVREKLVSSAAAGSGIPLVEQELLRIVARAR